MDVVLFLIFPLDTIESYLQDVKILKGSWGLRGGGDVFLLGAEFCFVWAALSVLALSVEMRGMGRVLECSRDLSRGGCCFVQLGS